jgi:outer membrane protein assembly factor BamA
VAVLPSKLPAQADPVSPLEGLVIDEIRLIGVEYTREFIVTRELTSRVGEPYSTTKARQDVEHLDRLGIFSQVDVHAVEESGRTVLEVDVVEATPILPIPAVRLTDQDGLQAGGGVRAINAFHRAISASAIAIFGGATNIEVTGKNPWITGNRIGLEFSVVYRDRFDPIFDFGEKSFELYANASTYLGEHSRANVRAAFTSLESDSSGITLDPDNTDAIMMVGASVEYDTRDSWSHPHAGWWNEVALIRSGAVAGDADFWRLILDVRRYVPIRRHGSLVITSLWTLTSGTVGQDVAVWQQWGFGGTNSVRGWPVASRTGKNQNINTAELRWNIREPKAVKVLGLRGGLGFQVALFADLGQLWNRSDEFTLDNFIGGYGAGFRLLVTGMGIVRFDVAFGEPGASLRFHVGGGEKAVKQRYRVR